MLEINNHNELKAAQKLGDALYFFTTPYRFAVSAITEFVQPTLYQISHNYIEDAITRNNAQNNPRLQKLLTAEIERRGLGPGQTQDVAEPILWQSIKIVAALSLPPITKLLENHVDGKNQSDIMWLSKGVCAGILVKESLDFARLIGRYTAGLEGAEQMALIREKSILNTGVDPFSSVATMPLTTVDDATKQGSLEKPTAPQPIR